MSEAPGGGHSVESALWTTLHSYARPADLLLNLHETLGGPNAPRRERRVRIAAYRRKEKREKRQRSRQLASTHKDHPPL